MPCPHLGQEKEARESGNFARFSLGSRLEKGQNVCWGCGCVLEERVAGAISEQQARKRELTTNPTRDTERKIVYAHEERARAPLISIGSSEMENPYPQVSFHQPTVGVTALCD